MGKVRQASVVVECDRCKRESMVTDDDQANHYRVFSEREDPDDRMFVAILNPPSGENEDVDFEYVCPKCTEAISGYMDKILMKKPVKKDKGGEEKGEGEEKPKPDKSSTKGKKPKEEKKEPAEKPAADEPAAENAEGEEEPAEEPDNQGEEEVDDDELFD
jgi:hypothetical protein